MGNNTNSCSTDTAGCCNIDSTRTIRDVSEVKKSADGVLISITATDVKADKLQEIVTSCQTGACDCIPAQMKEKITGMEILSNNGKLGLSIKGDVSEADIKAAMARSVKNV